MNTVFERIIRCEGWYLRRAVIALYVIATLLTLVAACLVYVATTL